MPVMIVALAITLNSASSKFRKDIIEVILVSYRLKEWFLRSGNKVGNAYFETSKFLLTGLRRISTKPFCSLPPPPPPFSEFDFIASQTAHLAS